MFNIDKLSRTPIYEQVIEQIKKNIIKGHLSPGDLLPSVRTLSQELSVNPNTLQKAYTEIEREGICYSVPGNGRYISPNAKEIVRAGKEQQLSQIAHLTEELAQAGIDMDNIIDTVKRAYYKQGGQKDDRDK